jgi:hypothetical protein
MESNKENNLIVHSKTYKSLYGFEEETTPLYYHPLKLITTAEFDSMISRNNHLSRLRSNAMGHVNHDHTQMLALLRMLLVNDAPDSDSVHASMKIVSTEEPVQIPLQKMLLNTKLIKPSNNFIFKNGDKYYGLTAVSFKNSIKRNCINEETKKVIPENIEEMMKELDKDPLLLFNEVYLHPVQLTLGKIITMMMPGIRASVISDMVTFIGSSDKLTGNEILDPHIHEVESNLITYYYNERNYGRNNDGTPLGNSCMRASGQTDQITFYEDNPDAVKMIVYIKEKKLEARALLWKNVHGDWIVDRIYYISSNTAIDIARYCKIKGYKTCYNANYHTYAIDQANDDDVIVKLNQIENREYQPYYDSMKYVDVINNLIAKNKNALIKYNRELERDYVILMLDGFRMGSMYRDNPWDDEVCPLSIKGQTKHVALQDIDGKRLQSFRDITIVKKPFRGLVAKQRVVNMMPGDIPTSSSYIRDMIRKYNCIRPVLRLDKKLTYRIADKKDTVFSPFHDSYILKDESIFVKSINGIALKKLHEYGKFREELTLLKLKRLYANKLVSVKPEGIQYLQEQLALIPGKYALSSIRTSRTFMIKASCITTTSIMLKGIPVPIKYIKIIKNQNNGSN